VKLPQLKLIDSHCHLDDKQFDADRDEVIARAREAGVERMMAIGTGNGPPDLEAALRLARQHDFIYATVGVHPHDAVKATPETFAAMEALAGEARVLAIGEIGLDYHYDFSRDVQREVFVTQLKMAGRAGKPIVIHTREAWDDTLAALRENWSGGCTSIVSAAALRKRARRWILAYI
jgi:TatD DNase family protein